MIAVQLHSCVIVWDEALYLTEFGGAEIADLQFKFRNLYCDTSYGVSCRQEVESEFTSQTEANGRWIYYNPIIRGVLSCTSRILMG